MGAATVLARVGLARKGEGSRGRKGVMVGGQPSRGAPPSSPVAQQVDATLACGGKRGLRSPDTRNADRADVASPPTSIFPLRGSCCLMAHPQNWSVLPERSFTLADSAAVYALASQSTPLGLKVNNALSIIDEAVASYGYAPAPSLPIRDSRAQLIPPRSPPSLDHLALSFNGGKDCTPPPFSSPTTPQMTPTLPAHRHSPHPPPRSLRPPPPLHPIHHLLLPSTPPKHKLRLRPLRLPLPASRSLRHHLHQALPPQAPSRRGRHEGSPRDLSRTETVRGGTGGEGGWGDQGDLGWDATRGSAWRCVFGRPGGSAGVGGEADFAIIFVSPLSSDVLPIPR